MNMHILNNKIPGRGAGRRERENRKKEMSVPYKFLEKNQKHKNPDNAKAQK